MSYIGTNKLGKVFLGTTAIGKAYLGTDLVFQTGPSLPAGYTRLQYVSTDSRANLDTGVAGTNDLEVSISFYVANYVQYGFLYGNYVDDVHRCCRAILNQQTSLFVAGGNNLAQAVSGFSLNAWHKLVVTASEAYFDNVRTSVASASLTDNSNLICLGNRQNGSTTFRDIGLRIKAFSIKKEGVLVLNYVPAKRDSDEKAGFYDLITETFYPSSTAVDFTAGPID